MANLKIRLFGEFSVARDGVRIKDDEWGGRKTRSLLKLLLTRPNHAFSRDAILDFLWPGVSPASSEKSLRVAVSTLRRVLEPDLRRGTDSRYILRKRPGYLFARNPHCEVDAWEFEERQKEAEDARDEERLEDAIAAYRSALDLIGGEFLAEDLYEDWTMEAREEWKERRLAVLSDLSECLALRGRYTEAIEARKEALDLDEYREDLHRGLMLCHYCAGEQALALQTFKEYERKLKTALAAAPSPDLVRLRDRIEARDVPGVDTGRRYPRPRRPVRFPYSLGHTRFVGRDAEYALLAGHLQEAEEGRGGAVAIEGEAGVGKSRLAEEFLEYARSRGARVFCGRSYERDLDPPLEPVASALGELMPDAPGSSIGDGTEDGGRLYQRITREILRESAGRGPAALFIDDAQWADATTLEFLSYLARRIPGERVLLLVAYRREEKSALSGWLGGLAQRRVVSVLTLERLSPEETRSLLEGVSSRGFTGLEELAKFIHRESEGNPYYITQYLRWLIENGTVEVSPRSRIRNLKEGSLREGVLPSGVRGLIQSRLDALDGEAREFLKFASVVGREFDPDLLYEDGAPRVIEPLLTSGLIVETPEERYRLHHDKLRQTLYEGTGAPERRKLHLRVAEALQKNGGEPAELAHHYLRARAWRPALENLEKAATKAGESHAWATALESYERALEIVGKLPDAEGRRFELLAARESLLERIGDNPRRVEAVREMFELANRLGDPARIAEVHLRRIGTLPEIEDAKKSARRAVGLFRELGEKAGEAKAYRELSYVLWARRDYEGALDAGHKALRAHREIEDRRGVAGDLANLIQIHRSRGDFEQALSIAGNAVREYAEVIGEEDLRYLNSMRLYTLVLIHRQRGDLQAALSANLEILAAWLAFGSNKTWTITAHNECASLYLSLARPEEALKHFRAAAKLGREIGSVRDEGHALLGTGLALERGGDPDGAADTYRRAAHLLGIAHDLSGERGEILARAEALALLAKVLHRSLEDPADALEAYESAAGIYRDLDEPAKLQETLLGMAGLRWRVGDPEGSARGYEEVLTVPGGAGAHEAAALASLSVVYRDLGEVKHSLRRGREALRMLRGADDKQAEAYVLSSVAESHRRLGHYSSAISSLRRSLRLRREIGDKEGEAGVLEDLARTRKEFGAKTRRK